MVVEVCPICDIAGCRHIRERKASTVYVYTKSQLDEAVRAAVEAEREECAKVADDLGTTWWREYKDRHSPFAGVTHHEGMSDGAFKAAETIRARGETK